MSRVYLASPYGFADSTKGFLQRLKSDLRRHGHRVVDPWEEGEPLLKAFKSKEDGLSPEKRVAELKKLNRRIAMKNRRAIERMDVVVAALDGPDVDSGTASEIGYAFARGKTVFGYRGDIRLTGENDVAFVNIQVQYWIEESGKRKGRIVRNVPDLLAALDAIGKGGRR